MIFKIKKHFLLFFSLQFFNFSFGMQNYNDFGNLKTLPKDIILEITKFIFKDLKEINGILNFHENFSNFRLINKSFKKLVENQFFGSDFNQSLIKKYHKELFELFFEFDFEDFINSSDDNTRNQINRFSKEELEEFKLLYRFKNENKLKLAFAVLSGSIKFFEKYIKEFGEKKFADSIFNDKDEEGNSIFEFCMIVNPKLSKFFLDKVKLKYFGKSIIFSDFIKTRKFILNRYYKTGNSFYLDLEKTLEIKEFKSFFFTEPVYSIIKTMFIIGFSILATEITLFFSNSEICEPNKFYRQTLAGCFLLLSFPILFILDKHDLI